MPATMATSAISRRAYPITDRTSVSDRLRRIGARITFFRLGDDPGLEHFVRQMAERVDGRVVNPDLDDLGAAVVSEYLSARRGYRPDYSGWDLD